MNDLFLVLFYYSTFTALYIHVQRDFLFNKTIGNTDTTCTFGFWGQYDPFVLYHPQAILVIIYDSARESPSKNNVVLILMAY